MKPKITILLLLCLSGNALAWGNVAPGAVEWVEPTVASYTQPTDFSFFAIYNTTENVTGAYLELNGTNSSMYLNTVSYLFSFENVSSNAETNSLVYNVYSNTKYTVNNVSGTGYSHSLTGQGLDFNGKTNVNLNGAAFAQTGNSPWTIMSWAKTVNTASGQSIGGWGQDSNAKSMMIYINSGGLIRCAPNGVTGPSGPTMATNVWYHIACTWDGTSMKLYINGSLYATTTPGALSITGGTNGYIGGSVTAPISGLDFNGTLDQWMIVNDIWTATQIADHYKYGLSTNRIGLKSYIFSGNLTSYVSGSSAKLYVKTATSSNVTTTIFLGTTTTTTTGTTTTTTTSTTTTLGPSMSWNTKTPASNEFPAAHASLSANFSSNLNLTFGILEYNNVNYTMLKNILILYTFNNLTLLGENDITISENMRIITQSINGIAEINKGVEGMGLACSGTQGINITTPALLSALPYNGPQTVMTWVYPQALSGYKMVGGIGNKQGYPLKTSLEIELYNGIPRCIGMNNNVYSTSEITTNTWSHIACVYHPDGTGMVEIYVNGFKTGSDVNKLNTTNDFIHLCCSQSCQSNFFYGRIDDFAVLSTNLSSSEIQNIYFKKLFVSRTTPTAWQLEANITEYVSGSLGRIYASDGTLLSTTTRNLSAPPGSGDGSTSTGTTVVSSISDTIESYIKQIKQILEDQTDVNFGDADYCQLLVSNETTYRYVNLNRRTLFTEYTEYEYLEPATYYFKVRCRRGGIWSGWSADGSLVRTDSTAPIYFDWAINA